MEDNQIISLRKIENIMILLKNKTFWAVLTPLCIVLDKKNNIRNKKLFLKYGSFYESVFFRIKDLKKQRSKKEIFQTMLCPNVKNFILITQNFFVLIDTIHSFLVIFQSTGREP